MGNGNLNMWQWPRNEAGKVIGWATNGRELENKGPFATPADLDGKQDAAANLDIVATEGVTDALLAAPSLLRNRNLDQVLFTDFFTSTAKLTDYRGGGNPDITQELNDMDAALSSGGVAIVPRKDAVISGTVTKKRGTNWFAQGSSVTDAWTCAYNGTIFDIVGNAASSDGSVEGIRLLGNKTTYPLSKAFNLDEVFTHRFKDLRIGGFNFGIYGIDCKALIMENLYIFDCATDGVMLEGTTVISNTDHRFHDCQLTGDRYGLHGKTGATFKLTACRPQGSGVSNLTFDDIRDSQMLGGYCDSAVIHASGGGTGARLLNCQKVLFSGVEFYSNGNGTSHVNVLANNAQSSDISVVGCTMLKQAGQSNVFGVTFNTPAGTGLHRRMIIAANNFVGCDQGVTGASNVDSHLRVDDTNIFPTGFGRYEALTETGSTLTPVRAFSSAVRVAGTAAAYDFTIPSAGNYQGKTMTLSRASGTGGAITMKSEAGTTVAVLPATINASQTVVCTTASSTATSVVWAPLGT